MKKAIVTGASKGLGAALVEALRAQGWQVLGIARHGADVSCDLSDETALAAWLGSGGVEAFLADASDIVLINNAGTVNPIAPVGKASNTDINTAIRLNVAAPIVLTNACVQARNSGVRLRVIHISSGAGRHAYPSWSTYCATKAALDMHAQGVAADRLDNVFIASIAPGIVDTQMQEQIRSAKLFPLREQFEGYYNDAKLASASDAAAKVLAMLSAPSFGETVIGDVRDVQ